MKKETIQRAKYLTGGLDLPGDKSISHRYAMLAALAEGISELRHFSAAADCHSTLACVSALGPEVKIEKDAVGVAGRGLRGLKSSWRALDAENSGTTMRLLAGILARKQVSSKLTGDGSLQKRPMKRVIGPLREMGADIRARDDNFAPLEIRGAPLKAIDYKMPMASAQVKSAVLLAGLFADGVTSITEPARTRDHTELALEEFGVNVEKNGQTIRVHGLARGNGSGKLTAKSLDVSEDLRRMGAKVEERPDGLRVEGRHAGKLRGAEITPRGDHRIAMAFAVAGLAAEGNTVIHDADCAAVSFPAFFAELNRLAER